MAWNDDLITLLENRGIGPVTYDDLQTVVAAIVAGTTEGGDADFNIKKGYKLILDDDDDRIYLTASGDDINFRNENVDGNFRIWLESTSHDGKFEIFNSDSETVAAIDAAGRFRLYTNDTTNTEGGLHVYHFAGQTEGTIDRPAAVIHNYTDNQGLIVDNVGSGAGIVVKNTSNELKRPGVTGNGDFLQFWDNTGAAWFRLFYNHDWTVMTDIFKFASNRADDGNVAFDIRAYQETERLLSVRDRNITIAEFVSAKTTLPTVSSLTSSTTTATMVFDTPHGLVTGDKITVDGVEQSGYNGTYSVTVSDTTTVTYTLISDPAVDTATGTIVVKTIKAHWKSGASTSDGLLIEAPVGEVEIKSAYEDIILIPGSGNIVKFGITGGTGAVTPTKYFDMKIGDDTARIAYEVIT